MSKYIKVEDLKEFTRKRFDPHGYYTPSLFVSCLLEDLEMSEKIFDVTELKHGEWQDVESYELVVYRCSECNKQSFVKYDFCPFCGADMRGD